MQRPRPQISLAAIVAFAAACSAPAASPRATEPVAGVVEPTSTASMTVSPSPTTRESAVPTMTYPPSTTGYGPEPMYRRPDGMTAGEVEPSAVDAALEEARRRLEDSVSYRFWWSIAGSGPAADGLAPGEPLILAGTADRTAESLSAAWSVTSPAGYAGRTIRYVVIGDDVWCDSGVGIWTVFEDEQAELALADAASLAPPGPFSGTFLDRDVELVFAGRERIGEVDALRLEARDASRVPLPGWWLGMDGELESFVLWLTAAGEPLQAEAAGFVRAGTEAGPFRMVMQVGALDDPANEVQPPS